MRIAHLLVLLIVVPIADAEVSPTQHEEGLRAIEKVRWARSPAGRHFRAALWEARGAMDAALPQGVRRVLKGMVWDPLGLGGADRQVSRAENALPGANGEAARDETREQWTTRPAPDTPTTRPLAVDDDPLGERIAAMRARAKVLHESGRQEDALKLLHEIRRLGPDVRRLAERQSPQPLVHTLEFPAIWPKPLPPKKACQTLTEVLPRLEFDSLPLAHIVDFLAGTSQTRIHVEWDALRRIGVEKTTWVKVALGKGTLEQDLRSVFRCAARRDRIIIVVGDEQITITVKKQESEKTQEGEPK